MKSVNKFRKKNWATSFRVKYDETVTDSRRLNLMNYFRSMVTENWSGGVIVGATTCKAGSKKIFWPGAKKNSLISYRIYSWKREKILKTLFVRTFKRENFYLFRTHVLGRLAWAVQLETGKTQRPLTYWIRRPTHRFGRLGISGMLAPLHSRPTRRSRGGGSGLVPRYMPIRSLI